MRTLQPLPLTCLLLLAPPAAAAPPKTPSGTVEVKARALVLPLLPTSSSEAREHFKEFYGSSTRQMWELEQDLARIYADPRASHPAMLLAILRKGGADSTTCLEQIRRQPALQDPARLIKAAAKGAASSFEALRQIPEFQSIRYVVLLRDLKITLSEPIPEGVRATITVSGQAVRPTRHPVSYFGYVVPTILDLRTKRIVWETRLKARPEGKSRNHHAEVQESLLRQFLDPILEP